MVNDHNDVVTGGGVMGGATGEGHGVGPWGGHGGGVIGGHGGGRHGRVSWEAPRRRPRGGGVSWGGHGVGVIMKFSQLVIEIELSAKDLAYNACRLCTCLGRRP